MTHQTKEFAPPTRGTAAAGSAPGRSPERPFPRTLSATWVVFYLVLFWLYLYLVRFDDIPNRFLIFDGLFLLATAVVVGRHGGAREVYAYFVGRLLPARRAWTTAFLLLVVTGLAFYAIGWGQAGEVERPDLDRLVLAPVSEEVVFRGVLLAALLCHPTAARWAMILLSALLFASCHGVEDGWRLLRLTTLGVICGCAYVLTRSVPFCALCHVFWNAMACCAVMQHGA